MVFTLTRHPSIHTGLIDGNRDLVWGTRLGAASRPGLKFLSRVELQISLSGLLESIVDVDCNSDPAKLGDIPRLGFGKSLPTTEVPVFPLHVWKKPAPEFQLSDMTPPHADLGQPFPSDRRLFKYLIENNSSGAWGHFRDLILGTQF